MNHAVIVTAEKRILRGGIQAVAGLSVVVVSQVLGAHVSGQLLPLLTAFVIFLIGAAQNYAEKRGWKSVSFGERLIESFAPDPTLAAPALVSAPPSAPSGVGATPPAPPAP